MNSDAHKALHKFKGAAAQEKRRKCLLDDQEKSREDLLDAHRNVMETFYKKVQKNRKLPPEHSLMLSEWFYRPPEDLADSWIFLACPVGQRCVLYTNNGYTYAYHKNGYFMEKFKSALPGGNTGKSEPHHNVILDCIYAKDTETFFVLDVLHWRVQPLVDTEFQCRRFMMDSFLADIPDLNRKTRHNLHPIVPILAHTCSAINLEATFLEFPYFPSNKPEVDGVLFYHKEAHYVRGQTPVVLWLKPFMLPEMFSVEVAPEYLKKRPEKYTNALDFMNQFDAAYAKKKGIKTVVNDLTMEEVVEPIPTLRDEVMDLEESDDEEERRRKLVAVELEE